MKADIVCEGGGVKGIALLGAIYYLEEQGYKFERFAGTSAGAIVTSLLAVGYSGKELKELLLNLNLKDFYDKNKLTLLPFIGPTISLFKNKGLFSGNNIESYLNDMYKTKGKTKFKDIAVNGVSPLKVIASDITNKQLLILPDDLIKYNIDPLEFEIAKAVRMSISIPFYFNPVILKNGKEESFIVDGGLLSNFPIWIFDVENNPRWPTFGLKLISNQDMKKVSPNKSNLISFAFDVVDTMLSKDDEAFLNNKDSIRTIKIRTYDVGTVDFAISKEEYLTLFNSGYNCAKTFLAKWNFNSYVSRYRT
ncbi:patatin-like phospholipase family protein [Clostridioides difficile]